LAPLVRITVCVVMITHDRENACAVPKAAYHLKRMSRHHVAFSVSSTSFTSSLLTKSNLAPPRAECDRATPTGDFF
jgi:hypothetical protein